MQKYPNGDGPTDIPIVTGRVDAGFLTGQRDMLHQRLVAQAVRVIGGRVHTPVSLQIAARQMQCESSVQQVVMIDCDVHQGNGTAFIFRDDASVFTFSIHGEKNFPFHKETGDLDIALPDGADDQAYLSALSRGLGKALHLAKAGLAIYLAGADPFINDRLGRMALTKQGLAKRDQMVLEACRLRSIPVAVVMAGGYAPQIEDIVDIHCQTIRLSTQFSSSLA